MPARKYVLAALGIGALAGLLFTAHAASSDGPRPLDPQQQAAAQCRAGAREAFSAVATDTPSMTQDEAQALVDASCGGVSVTDREAIVSAERTAAIARYLDEQAKP